MWSTFTLALLQELNTPPVKAGDKEPRFILEAPVTALFDGKLNGSDCKSKKDSINNS